MRSPLRHHDAQSGQQSGECVAAAVDPALEGGLRDREGCKGPLLNPR